MSDMHNLQIVISQSPKQNRILTGPRNGAANGSQITNIVNQEKTDKKLKEVQELEKKEKIKKSQREDPKREEGKKKRSKGIDIYQ